MINTLPGTKYYRFIDDNNIEVIRLNRLKGEDYSVINENTGKYEKISKEKILNDYILLRPDGYVTFMIVNLSETMKDVLITLHRKEDIGGENIPYAVCRQFMDDLFTNNLISNKIDMETNQAYHSIGVSISQDTCPANVDFKATLIGNGVENQSMIAVYVDDKLSTILSLINKKKYNDTLTKIYNSQAKPFLIGLCPDIQTLLTENNFMYDFCRGFNIYQIPFGINPNFEGSFTDQTALTYLNKLLQVTITKTYVTKFSKEINLKEIQKDFIIVSDITENLFIIAYDKLEVSEKSYEMVDRHKEISANKWDKYNS